MVFGIPYCDWMRIQEWTNRALADFRVKARIDVVDDKEKVEYFFTDEHSTVIVTKQKVVESKISFDSISGAV